MPASPFLAKLNVPPKGDVLILNEPELLSPQFAGLPGVTVQRDAARAKKVSWLLAFVKTEDDVKNVMRAIGGKMEGDATLWFAFPKQSSRRYESEINGELGWDPLGKAGFDGVRGVALDEDWSAIRFRREAYIGKMTKNPAWILSAAGKKRAQDRRGPTDE